MTKYGAIYQVLTCFKWGVHSIIVEKKVQPHLNPVTHPESCIFFDFTLKPAFFDFTQSHVEEGQFYAGVVREWFNFDFGVDGG